MKKKITRVYTETNAKLQLDRFFEVCRTNLKIFAFQDKSTIEFDCLKEHEVCFLLTLHPKRDFFKDNNTLVDSGMEILFNNFTNELLDKVKTQAIRHFGNKFFIKVIKDDTRDKEDKSRFSGKFLLVNLKD